MKTTLTHWLLLGLVPLFILSGASLMGQTYTQTTGSVSTCSGTFFDSGGSLGSYNNFENSTYTICSNSGNCLNVNFTSFDIETNWDYLYIYDGPTTASPLVGTYTGTNSPGNITASGTCLTFRFTSDGSITYPGWTANISCVSCGGGGGGCLPNMGNGCNDVACSGSFFDPGGSAGNYLNSQNVTHTICGTAGSCVSVNFSAFDLESGWDFLTIYDGPTTASPVIGTYTGTISPGTITSTTGCLTFQFTSDASVTRTGWAASISCSPCGGGGGGCLPNMGNCTDNACSGNFFDSGGSIGNYGNSENLSHTICSNSGNCVQVSFTSFDLESGFDFLTVYDGPTTSSPVLGTYTGTTSPGTVTSTNGCLTFVFTSDGSINRAGWNANINCTTCPVTSGCLIDPVSNLHGTPPGFTQACDDLCSSSLLPLGFTYHICGLNFTNMYVNMNGNVTFGSSYITFTPVGMPNASTAVMVAPFWADVDTRSCGTVYYQANPTNVIVTWHQVGYYASQCDKQNTFQLVMTNGFDPLLGNGNNTGFYFGQMAWTTGSASLGVNGFGGAPATVGINANDGFNYSAVGRFDQPGTAYDGPAGLTDGVDYLDNQCFVFPAGGCNVILPVDYLKISATPVDGRFIQLDWSTNSEFNNLGFDIERSVDGINFERIGYQEGAGQQGGALMEYTFQDDQVERNKRYYYRLYQHGVDGNSAYSTVVQARLIDNHATTGEVFPNPFKDQISVEVTSEKDAQCTARLIDAFGQEVQVWHQPVRAGDQTLELSTGDLAHGVYFLHIWVDGQKIALEKMVK